MKQQLRISTADFPMGLSVNDTVRASGLGRDTIYLAIRSGTLVARKYGRRTLILRRDLEAFLSSLPEARLRTP